MILQALHDYYRRKMADPDRTRRLPAFGWEEKEIPFILELTRDGRLAAIKDTRSGDGKKKVATRFLVPKGVKKSVNIAASLLWGNAEYVLGAPDPKKLAEKRDEGKANDYLDRLREMHAAFRRRIDDLPSHGQADQGIRAVRSFLDTDPVSAVAAHPAGAELLGSNPTLSLRVADDIDLVCQRPAVTLASVAGSVADGGGDDNRQATPSSVCLITGDFGPPQRLHDPIKGVWNAQTSGADIVSFNRDAFTSYGKTQGANAPIGRVAAFGYTTALNHLLGKGSRQRMQVGDASTVFWAQKTDDADVEDWFAEAFGNTDDPDAHTAQVRALFEAVASGRFDGARGQNRFYVLGLAPNAARIAVRFWHEAPLHEIAARIRRWFDDLALVRSSYDIEFPPLQRLLSAVCLATKERPHGDIDRLPPTIAGDLMRSILEGGELPATLLTSALQRCRAEQAKKDDKTGKPVRNVSYLRAALIRASLNRHSRIHAPHREEIAVSLDKTSKDRSYLLGRLFATFERMQEVAAERDLNRTIRDSYFGAAMATPRSVFPRLVRLNQQHLRDLKRGRPRSAAYFDRLLRGINGDLDPATAFPATSTLREQGVFAIGYYHQRQDFFPSNDAKPADEPESANQGSET